MTTRRLAAVTLVVLCAACAPTARKPPKPEVAATLRVGTSGDYVPFSIRTGDEFHGFDIEAAMRFAKDTGRRIEFVDFQWASLERDLAANKFDVAMGGVTVLPSRARVGTFTRPLVRVGAMVLARPGVATVARDLDARGRRIGVNAGGYLERVARRLFPRAQIVAVPDNRQVAGALAAGAADAIVTDEIEAPLFQRAVPDAVAIGPLTSDRKAYLVRDPALAAELDAWLRAREADGFLAGLRTWALGPRWGVRPTVGASDLDALLAAIDLRQGFMPSIAEAKERRGMATRDAAREEGVRTAARDRARQVGAPSDAVDALVVALIDAGSAVQDTIRGTPAGARPPVDAIDLDESRGVLDGLTTQIVDRARDLSSWPSNVPKPTAAALADALDPSLTPAASRRGIAEAVVGLLGAR